MGQYTVGEIPYICATDNNTEVKPLVHVAATWEVNVIAAATAGVLATDITMVAAAAPLPAGAFHEWKLAKVAGKNSYKEEKVGDEDGGIKTHTYVCIMNKVTAARLEATQGGCEQIIIFHDNNGQKWLMGEKDNGCSMIRGAEIGATNTITVTFVWRSGKNIIEYTGVIPT